MDGPLAKQAGERTSGRLANGRTRRRAGRTTGKRGGWAEGLTGRRAYGQVKKLEGARPGGACGNWGAHARLLPC